ncbi:hypothetical protein FD51_GL000693 [Lacticaseibacillus zeae DSM 20178 = KCTC 3804]|uniref:Uncharacterized protein n=2 Tax=Lacticaseibacillus zeae TaxID=57037 RepID=A0A5R8LKI9_LACZE|nr:MULTISPECIES: hypothetical protein [Lacticaseibacillus]KRK11909.1 hypothetical protein FD51_GL000693 [Lacticaseibacillus zeae DSM 20178 = KCTC 3804]MDE3283274.1 hypothetical protein [Lacticaseibacillus casei]OLS07692.1 hypothetical protein AUQ39_08630 [Lacticaseibacillus casei]QVI31439.1 hypothetical protein KG087_11005 [Lacticaseibacillus zeae]TLF37729.1 hypothetical protein FEI14_15240 [Lacticaseibacillus zeae]
MSKNNNYLNIGKKIANYAVFPLTLAIVVGLTTPGSFIFQAFNNEEPATVQAASYPAPAKRGITPYGLGNYTVYVYYSASQMGAVKAASNSQANARMAFATAFGAINKYAGVLATAALIKTNTQFSNFRDAINSAIAQKKGLQLQYNTTFDNGNNSDTWGAKYVVK